MHSVLTRIRHGLAGGHPLIYVHCAEEERLEGLLAQISPARFGAPRAPVVWTEVLGFRGLDTGSDCRDPMAALEAIRQQPHETFYLLKDLPARFESRPELVRALRDLYLQLAGTKTCLFISSSDWNIPESLTRMVFTVELGVPDLEEIKAEMGRFLARVASPDYPGESWLQPVAVAMQGLLLNEVKHLIRRLVVDRKWSLDQALVEIREEKAATLMREACLRYIPDTVDIARVGGLENLKEWVTTRRVFFSGEKPQGRIPPPSGVLFMGVSGCGKSMAAKVIASAWSLPLVRLDMNLVLSGAFGSAEYAFDYALRLAERIAPVVLWIDEMENSFGYDSETRRGNNPNIFSSFLTWMQEKPPGVFVVATANRIELLPAEVIRKGRFDQLFFLDLPNEEERTRIIEIHLAAAGADYQQFNLKALAAMTKNWSGAEIEQAIKAAVVHAWEDERDFTERDILWSTARIVPLSRTMAEQIKQLRLWSQDRAAPASARGAP